MQQNTPLRYKALCWWYTLSYADKFELGMKHLVRHPYDEPLDPHRFIDEEIETIYLKEHPTKDKAALWVQDEEKYGNQPLNIASGFVITGDSYEEVYIHLKNSMLYHSMIPTRMGLRRVNVVEGVVTSANEFKVNGLQSK